VTALLAVCLAAAPMGVCQAEALDVAAPGIPDWPAWASAAWQEYAASIVAGESVPGCEQCDLWIACTIVDDVARGHDPWRLHPGRWHGWGRPSAAHRWAVRRALSPGGCAQVPRCRYLGNVRDYLTCWNGMGPGLIIGNEIAGIVCVVRD